MKISSQLSSRSVKTLLVAAAILLPAAGAVADTIYTAAATKGGAPFARKGVTITKIEKTDDGEVLRYSTPSGDTASKKLDDIVRIEADGETVFNQAEAEFLKGDLQAAGDDYGKAISSSSKEWVKHRSDVRLLFISGKTGNFLAAVKGWVELAKKDSASAATRKPTIPATSADFANAIAAINQGLAGATAETQLVVLPFLAEIQTKSGDLAGAKGSLARYSRLRPQTANPATPSGGVDTGSNKMEENRAAADIALAGANKAIASRDYATVIKDINGASASFVAPDQQAQALYLLAESKDATATTPEAMEDAATAYMRVVAHFKSQADPAADALYKTGVIEEKLKKTTEAKLIYGQVMNEYRDTKAAQDAKAALARLNG